MIRIAMSMLILGGAAVALPLLALAQGNAPAAPSAAQSEAAKKFRAYLEDDWKKWMAQLPEMASSVGYPGHNREWRDDSPAGIEARQKHLHESVAGLKAISFPFSLDKSDSPTSTTRSRGPEAARAHKCFPDPHPSQTS